jgi:heterodisulfide reductase subunit B
MKYAYYPGCSLHSMAREYDISLRAVCRTLGIEPVEVKDWICCGSPAAHASPRSLHLALSLENLAKMDQQGLSEALVPCAACFSRFKFAQASLRNSPEQRRELEEAVGHRFSREIKVLHPLELLSSDETLEKIESRVNGGLQGLKVVCYYGCLLVRPPEIAHFDDAERPQCMNRLMRALGADVLEWDAATECCGAFLSLTRTDIVIQLSHGILDAAKQAGAEAIVVACPMCHFNLDSRQAEIEASHDTRYDLPIYYFTQLMGLALGLPKKKLRLDRHFVAAGRVLEKVEAP